MIITDKIVTDEGIFKTNGRPLGKSEDVRNYIERHSERYLIAENSWDEWEYAKENITIDFNGYRMHHNMFNKYRKELY